MLRHVDGFKFRELFSLIAMIGLGCAGGRARTAAGG